ncbi:hypothetical protein AAXE64_27330 [Priestia megaterium]
MYELQTFDKALLDAFMKEYIDVCDTMMLQDMYKLEYVPVYIPSFFDVVNVLQDSSYDNILLSVGALASQHSIFFKMPDGFRNVPIVEVW